mmetsp:Transcript_38332/g.48856  ORF Transcript_38332/g.48856 Transcript_38332/m.48856 type:complete len:184 (-) Transcript_38332:169-720(-)
MVLKSLLTIVNVDILLPAVACLVMGNYALEHRYFSAEAYWLSYLLFLIGACVILLTMIGAAAQSLRNRHLLLFYMVCTGASMILSLGVGIACTVYSDQINKEYQLKAEQDLQEDACDAGLYGCCCCSEDQCPEWNKDDIIIIVQASLRLLGMLGFIVATFNVPGVLGANAMYKSLAGYQSQSI